MCCITRNELVGLYWLLTRQGANGTVSPQARYTDTDNKYNESFLCFLQNSNSEATTQ